jgi:hypothetical protein
MNQSTQAEITTAKVTTDEQPSAFDYGIINDEFHNLLVAAGNKLEREWPPRYENVGGGQMILLQLVRLATTTYKAMGFLCADVKDGAERDPLFALATPPLNRTILEIIISMLYLLEDLPRHTELFYRAGWRDEEEMLIKYRERYSGRLLWDQYIAHRTEMQTKIETNLGITPEEKNDLNKILRWPKPAKVIRRLQNDYPQSDAIPFIQFLDDWLYRELSTQSHLEPRGLGELGLYFLGMDDLKIISGEDRDGIRARLNEKIAEFRTTQMWTAITLMLALISEIEVHFGYGLKQKLMFIWTLVNAHNEISQEVFSERYEKVLA